MREQGCRVNRPARYRPLLIFVGLVVVALLLSSTVRDGGPSVSADSLQAPPPNSAGIIHQPVLTDPVGRSLQYPVPPTLADFVIASLSVDTPIVAGQSAELSATLRNNGNTPVGPYDLDFYFTADGGVTRIAAATTEATAGPYSAVQAGDSDSLALDIEVPGVDTLPVGAYQLCVQIQSTVSGADTTEIGNSECEHVFALPDMSDHFPDEIRPMHYQSPVDEEWSIGNCVPRSVWEVLDEEVIPNLPGIAVPAYGAGLRVAEIVASATTSSDATPSAEQTYWILMPHPYTKPAIRDDLHDGIHGPFEFGALSKYGNRVRTYKEIALEIATREALSEEVYTLTLQEGVEGTVNAVELAGMASDFSEALGLDLSAEILGHHLQFLRSSHLFDGLAIGEPVVDAFFSAAVQRTIEFETATETLTMLKQLPMDEAWSDGVDCASIELYRMMSADFMERWADELRKNRAEIAQAISLAVIKSTAKVGAKLILGKATVLAAPITLTVGLAVLSVYELITFTHEFWSHVRQGTTAAQVYAHLYGYSQWDDHWDELLKLEALQYTEFLFYRHLQAASTYDRTYISILDLEDGNYPQNYARHLAKRRDQELRKLLDTTWNPARDVNNLKVGEDYGHQAVYELNGGIWSDGDTVWIASYDEEAIFAFNMADGSWDADQLVTLDRSNAKPRGIWADDTTMWVADASGTESIYGYARSDLGEDTAEPISQFALHTDTLIPSGIWSDGTTMWVADQGWIHDLSGGINFQRKVSKIYAYRLSDGAHVPGEDFETLRKAGNHSPEGIWSDGQTMWVADADDGKIYAYDMESKEHDPRRDITAVAIPDIVDNRPLAGIWSDGETMWVLDATEEEERQGEDKLFAYEMTSKPRNLQAKLAPKDRAQRIVLEWNEPRSNGGSDITGYMIQVSEADQPWNSFRDDTGTNATSHAHIGAAADTTYRYRVAAISGDRLGFWSDVATITTLAGPTVSTLNCWPRKVIVGQSVTCNPRVSGGFSSEYNYQWAANIGMLGDPYSGNEEQFTTKWSWHGNARIGVTVCDEAIDRCGFRSQTIKVVVNSPPEVTAETPEQFLRVQTGVSQEFTVKAYDPDGNFTSWEWSVNGDRKGGENPISDERFSSFYKTRAAATFNYTFPGPDRYDVVVRFTDGEGSTGLASWTVYASSPRSPQSPTITDIIMTGDGGSFSTLWEPPASSGGRTPTSYDLRYAKRLRDAAPSWTTVSDAWQSGFPYRATVRDLDGGASAEYDVEVRAVHGNDPGPWSATVIAAPQSEVLVTDFASQFALDSFAPTDTTLDVRLLPAETSFDLPSLEITILDEEGFSNRPGAESDDEELRNSILSPGSVTIAVPKEVWVEYRQATLEIHMNGQWRTYIPAVERTLVAAEAIGLGWTGFLTGRSLMPGLYGVSRSLVAFQDWQATGAAESDIDDVFGEDYLNCFSQVSRSWRVPVGLPGVLKNVLGSDFGSAKGVRLTIPISVGDDDYVSLAASFIASENSESKGETSLVHVPNLLGASETSLNCQPPAPGTE